MKKILVIGAGGQIGTELVHALAARFGKDVVLASDIKEVCPPALSGYSYRQLDVLNKEKLDALICGEEITEVYLLAALLSATAEKNPKFGWELNMNSLLNVLDLAKEKNTIKVFWPSSIAAFGPTTPKEYTPQDTIMDPTTVYGISKLAGERWCNYYREKFKVDVRSVRYPGLISYSSLPGGGTTDYAVDIFYHAKDKRKYCCFLSAKTSLPMMYMEDAIRATIDLMETPLEKLQDYRAYNLAGISFNPEELAIEIQKHIPDFTIDYAPDFRQAIADTWPKSIDDKVAEKDWGWKHAYTLEKLVEVMLENVNPSLYFTK